MGVATVVSSIVIVVIAFNSQGSHAGLLSMPVAVIILGIIGIAFFAMALYRMAASDLNNEKKGAKNGFSNSRFYTCA